MWISVDMYNIKCDVLLFILYTERAMAQNIVIVDNIL